MPVQKSFDLAMQHLGEQHKDTVLPAMNALATEIVDGGGITAHEDAFMFALHGEIPNRTVQPFAGNRATSGYKGMQQLLRSAMGEPILFNANRPTQAGLVVPLFVGDRLCSYAFGLRRHDDTNPYDRFFAGALVLNVASRDPQTNNVTVKPRYIMTSERREDLTYGTPFENEDSNQAQQHFYIGRQAIKQHVAPHDLAANIYTMDMVDRSIQDIRQSEAVQDLLDRSRELHLSSTDR
ncbi:MAG: hypothetical protein WBP26_02930 [Candidatus Saccharimonadales bacterium]